LKRGRLWPIACVGLLTACELTSTSITQPEDAIIVEAFVGIGGLGIDDPFTTAAQGRVYIHGVLGGQQALTGPPDVTVTMSTQNGASTVLTERPQGTCVASSVPAAAPGRCYAADLHAEVRPGITVSLRVETTDGRVIAGSTTLPQDFEILSPVAAGQTCALPANTRVELRWTASPGAWAYPSETLFSGLGERLAVADPDFLDLEDPLIVFGLAISDADTTLSFPNEFGVFDRFGDDHLLVRALVAIQDGLPDGVRSRVTVSAADRNWVNWERGGNFNPSGPVRVPSVGGDGFGVFGSMILKTIAIEVGDLVQGRPACTGIATTPNSTVAH